MMAKAKKAASVVLRARVSAATAQRIRRIAKAHGKTESEILRDALALLERRERRAKGVEMLISLIPDKIPTKEEYAGWEGRP